MHWPKSKEQLHWSWWIAEAAEEVWPIRKKILCNPQLFFKDAIPYFLNIFEEMYTPSLSHYSERHIFVQSSILTWCNQGSFPLCFNLKIRQWIWHLINKLFGPWVACIQDVQRVCRGLCTVYLTKQLVVHCSVGDSACSRKAAWGSVSISKVGLWRERLKEFLRIRSCLLPFVAVGLWWK